jgi:hypothetical protein
MLAVATFFGGMALQRQFDKPQWRGAWSLPIFFGEKMVDRDGTEWFRYTDGPVELGGPSPASLPRGDAGD